MLFLNRLWYPLNKVSRCAYPLVVFSHLYRCVIFSRKKAYQYFPLLQKRFPVPVIVVGNITVGGCGKTPLVAFLVEKLKAAGYRPGIVSRGYGSKSKQFPQLVSQKSGAAEVGDEALMLTNKTQVPVVIDPKRPRAIGYLLAQHDCDVIISDDGLQHYAMTRNVEIAVVDGERRFGNGYCLPLGPLREPIKRLQQVDFVVVNGAANAGEFAMNLAGNTLQAVNKPLEQLSLQAVPGGQRLHAVAAIGNPQRFFQSLSDQGLSFTAHTFADHHAYQSSDFAFLGSDDLVIMTEKDAVKCVDFADQRFYYLPVKAEVDKQFISEVLAMLNSNPVISAL